MDSIKVLSRGGKEIVLHTKNGLLDHISVGNSTESFTLDSYYPDSISIEEKLMHSPNAFCSSTPVFSKEKITRHVIPSFPMETEFLHG